MFVLLKHFIRKTNKKRTILKCYGNKKELVGGGGGGGAAGGTALQVEMTKWCGIREHKSLVSLYFLLWMRQVTT